MIALGIYVALIASIVVSLLLAHSLIRSLRQLAPERPEFAWSSDHILQQRLFKVIWGNEFSGHSKVRWLKWSVRVTQIVPVLLLGVLVLLALG